MEKQTIPDDYEKKGRDIQPPAPPVKTPPPPKTETQKKK
jgi:hypothetical protein